MVLRGKQRSAANRMSEDAKLNRIARTTPLLSPQPTDGLRSSAEALGDGLRALYSQGQRLAGMFRVDETAIWEEMLARSKGQRR